MIQKTQIHKNLGIFIECHLVKRRKILQYNVSCAQNRRIQTSFALLPGRFRLRPLAAPSLEFHVQRADGIDKDHQDQGIHRLVQVTQPPGDGDNRQVDQVGVKACAAHLADQRNAEESCRKSLATQE